jgi:hypothetical protein
MPLASSGGAETLLRFPCEFPIKAFGHNTEDFDLQVVAIIRRHVPELAEGAVKRRLSAHGRYIAVTVTIMAHSQDQIDAIYRDLCGHEQVMLAL